ncbi:trehalase-like protein [Christiangramia fulva]|uniref:Trehalase-like protein n=1 Tax=Christiangramia fulva TaxID=2126553 RepID=A0A2R3Z8G2_9FLAO|nr:trehalase-like protein [Christiangramia fulva]AVR46549.1 trehalase-like protein [Christiangramia fulva]
MEEKELFDSIKSLLLKNMEKGGGRKKSYFHFTRPSPGTYPYQYFWDTCFHVYILCALGEASMAKSHIESLMALQKEDGFIGHMIYWDRLKPNRLPDLLQSLPRFRNLYKSHMSALIQPPLLAQAVQRIYNITGDKAFVEKLMPGLKKYYQWLAKNRDFDDTFLLTIISPYESGMDWKPSFDIPLDFTEGKATKKLFRKVTWVDFRNFLNNYKLERIWEQDYFLVKDAGFNTIYAQNLETMACLCELTGDGEITYFKELSEKVTQAILKLMYHEKDAAFYDLYGKNNEPIRILTPTIFYPVVLEGIPAEIKTSVIKEHFFNKDEFQSKYPIPSVAMKESAFNPNESVYIWRGPTWIVNNWFLHKFLMENEYSREARSMVESIKTLIAKSGFREYYNPFTGEGYGAKEFTWAGLVADMMLMEQGRWNDIEKNKKD